MEIMNKLAVWLLDSLRLITISLGRFIGGFLKRNASQIIACMSMLTAVASLYATIKSQQVDREYKELSIRPALALRADHFKVTLRNGGIGPAVLKKVFFAFDGKCYDIDSAEGSAALPDRLVLHLYKKSFGDSLNTVDGILHVDMESPPRILRAGEEAPIMSLSRNSQSEFDRVFQRLSVQEQGDAAFNFLQQSRAVLIGVVYCSISGKYCPPILIPSGAEVSEVKKCEDKVPSL